MEVSDLNKIADALLNYSENIATPSPISSGSKRPAQSLDESTSSVTGSSQSQSDTDILSDNSDFQSDTDMLKGDEGRQLKQLNTAANLLLELADLGPQENRTKVKVTMISGEFLVSFPISKLNRWNQSLFAFVSARAACGSTMGPVDLFDMEDV